MPVSVETLQGLERKLSVSVSAEQIEDAVGQRLKDLAKKVKMDGFRPGKAPMTAVKQRYSEAVREEVARDMIQSTLVDALRENDLNPAGMPHVEPSDLEIGKDFHYTATFEIFPVIEVAELNKSQVEIAACEVKDSDVDTMIDKLLDQNKEWHEIEKAAAKGHKVVIDFEGFLDNAPFEGGSAKGFELALGSGSMIPGFEEGILKAKPGSTFDINVTFPKDYGHEKLAGKDAVFKITLHKVMEGKKPALDDEFVKKFNIKKGGVEALKKDIKENMVRELDRRLSKMNKEALFDKLLDKNSFDIPKALIDNEIENMKHEMYHRLFGHEHHDNEQIPDFPRELFEEQATKRVKLGLLIHEYVKKHNLKATKQRINALIDGMASAYEHPEELRAWYEGNKEHMAEIEGLALEDLVAETIQADAKIKEKKMSYDEVMNPEKKEAKPAKESKKKGD